MSSGLYETTFQVMEENEISPSYLKDAYLHQNISLKSKIQNCKYYSKKMFKMVNILYNRRNLDYSANLEYKSVSHCWSLSVSIVFQI